MATINEVKAAKRIYEDEKKLAEQKVKDSISIHHDVMKKVKDVLPAIKDELDEICSWGYEGNCNYFTLQRDHFSVRFEKNSVNVYYIRSNCRNEYPVYSLSGFTEDEYVLIEFVSLWSDMKDEILSLIQKWYENITKNMLEQATKRYNDEVYYHEKIAAI